MPHRKPPGSDVPIDQPHREKVARVRLGSYEFKKKGVSRFDLRDPYHLAIALTWPQFLASLLVFYLSVNVVFATLFWLAPGSVEHARPGSFADAFFFSIETVATVGYGQMYPATLYGHLIASLEIVCGLASAAILTGLTFVRKVAQIAFKPDWTKHAKAPRSSATTLCSRSCPSASWCFPAPASRTTSPTRPGSSGSQSGSSAKAARERRLRT